MRDPGTIHLVEGPVGAGKSTYCARLSLARGIPHLNLDEWMVTLFSPDRPQDDFLPWYMERKERCLQQIWQVACSILDTGSDVILELGLVQRAAREAFYALVDANDYPLEVTVLQVPIEVRRERVRRRNEERGSTYRMTVTDEVFQMADAAWQPPDEQEVTARRVLEIDP